MKRKIAIFLSAIMLLTSVTGNVSVAAAEVQETNNEIVENQNNNGQTSEITQGNSENDRENEGNTAENQTENVTEDHTTTEAAATTESSEEEQAVINYLAVDQGYLQSPGEQKVVVSFGKGTENIEQPRLSFQKADGSVIDFAFSEKNEELFLFFT